MQQSRAKDEPVHASRARHDGESISNAIIVVQICKSPVLFSDDHFLLFFPHGLCVREPCAPPPLCPPPGRCVSAGPPGLYPDEGFGWGGGPHSPVSN